MLLAAVAVLGLIVQRHSPRPPDAPIDHHCHPTTAACIPATASFTNPH
jgi:hypothetical protein